MLRLKEITKQYPTGAGIVHALRGVTLDFRDNEFVAILGPSGCGKTTLLNIVGGLDSYTTGDLEINGISTRTFRDAQWDAYRNHNVGFVFQSYNLIPHQTVLANVELALKLSHELTTAEQRERALAALERVGLSDQVDKKPTMLSGGQMQRVAIARALVNDPTIILADEPTGALDSETSRQVMEVLREVSRDHLVVMVTHNPELADEYATRIVRLKDGIVTSDTNPPSEEDFALAESGVLPTRTRLRMSTALSLSLTNLMTKKGRTFLTSFAGAIGIIGIALILSISSGVNNYIDNLQRTTMTSYPITIEEETYDLSSMMSSQQDIMSTYNDADHDLDAVYADSSAYDMSDTITTNLVENNLSAFKRYLDDPESPIHEYLGEHGVVYSYNTSFGVYAHDEDNELVSASTITIGDDDSLASYMMRPRGAGLSAMMGGYSTDTPYSFSEMLCSSDGMPASALRDSYDLLAGAWPESKDEVVLVLNSNNEIDLDVMYGLGLLPLSDYRELQDAFMKGEATEASSERIDYDDVLGQTLYLLPAADQYVDNGDGTYAFIGEDAAALEAALDDALELHISGIVRSNDEDGLSIYGSVGYTTALTEWIIEHTEASAVVAAQEASPEINVLTGLSFAEDDVDEDDEARAYIEGLSTSELAQMARQMMDYASILGDVADSAGAAGVGEARPLDTENMTDAELAEYMQSYLLSDAAEELRTSLYATARTDSTYEDNLMAFGVVNPDSPTSISLYVDSFDAKDGLTASIEDYNMQADPEDQITYTDYIALITSSITMIIDAISYVLVAFVAISLIVSSIMIAIITYISVLERTKEIGVLRALGASKGDVSKIFNAETLIEGLLSGLIGVGVAAILCLPITAVIQLMAEVDIVVALPIVSAVVLVCISVGITLVAGFIPSRMASRKDPAVALRSE